MHPCPPDTQRLLGTFKKSFPSVPRSPRLRPSVFNPLRVIPRPNVMVFVLFFSADDHSRVILSQVDGTPCSDYINASYIDVSAPQPRVVLTPGPLGVECGW